MEIWSVKRGRFLEDQGRLPQRDERDYSPPSSRTHRTLSSVVMPTTIGLDYSRIIKMNITKFRNKIAHGNNQWEEEKWE